MILTGTGTSSLSGPGSDSNERVTLFSLGEESHHEMQLNVIPRKPNLSFFMGLFSQYGIPSVYFQDLDDRVGELPFCENTLPVKCVPNDNIF